MEQPTKKLMKGVLDIASSVLSTLAPPAQPAADMVNLYKTIVNELTAKVIKSEEKKEELEKLLTDALAGGAASEAQLQQARASVDKLTTNVKDLNAQLEKERENNATLVQRFNDLQGINKERGEELSSIKLENANMRKAAEQQQEELLEAQEAVYKLNDFIDIKQCDVVSARQAAAEYQEEAGCWLQEFAELQNQYEEQRARFERTLAEAEEQLLIAKAEHVQASESKEQLVADLQSQLECKTATHATEMKSSAARVHELTKEVVALKAELTSVKLNNANLKTAAEQQQEELLGAAEAIDKLNELIDFKKRNVVSARQEAAYYQDEASRWLQDFAELQNQCDEERARFERMLAEAQEELLITQARHAEECDGLKKQLEDAVQQARNDAAEHLIELQHCQRALERELARVTALLHAAQPSPTGQAFMSIDEAKVKEASLQVETQEKSDDDWSIPAAVAEDSTLLSASSVDSSIGVQLPSPVSATAVSIVTSLVTDTEDEEEKEEQQQQQQQQLQPLQPSQPELHMQALEEARVSRLHNLTAAMDHQRQFQASLASVFRLGSSRWRV